MFYLFSEFNNGVTGTINFFPDAGLVTERAVIHQLNRTIILKLPIWNGFDKPGSIKIIDSDDLIEKISGKKLIEKNQTYLRDGFYNEVKYFLDCIKKNIKLEHGFKTALQPMELMECLKKRKNKYMNPDMKNF